MKTREEIRMQFFTENNGAYWTNSQEEPDIDYVHWLEDKLINKLTIPVVVKSFYCLKKEGVIEEHEKCDKQCSYCKMEKSLQ